MSDILTPNLGLVKPDVGGSDDTWGEKLNSNFDKLDSAVGTGTGVTDGDKGDIIVSSSGTVWLFDPSVVTVAGRALLDDPDAATQLVTLGAAPVVHSHVAANITDFSEAVDDRVGALLVAGSNISLVYNDAANSLTIHASGGSGGGVTDGDKGDITISSGG